ncbi:tetratricopeptide repeat protein [Mucilaginibacter antarcticus]|uniref:tetratricopeptide repeat protein n=1 Tax=Mucilaginibacter antarcticus TaxID=1855725 RepID=UPI0036287B4E
MLIGKHDSALAFLKNQRSKFSSNDPQLAAYYEFMSVYYHALDTAAVTRYADSAIAIFNSPDPIKKYPRVYFKVLLAKGDACILGKQYETALGYYDRAKQLLADGRCDNGNVASKIGGIYFNQKNYAMAAKYWVESYNRLLACATTISPRKLFYLKQAALNSTGVSYERAGKLDSAYYFYKLDLDFINETERSGVIEKSNISAPRIIVYDNIGGLKLKQGNLKEAKSYLIASVSIPVMDVDGMRITPNLKLAQLYLKTGELDKVALALEKADTCLTFIAKLTLCKM